jgi:hypothetical protein
MKKGLVFVAVAVAIALVGAGAAALPLAQEYVAGQIKRDIEQDGAVSVGDVEVGILDRRLTLHDLRSKQIDGLSAARWEATGLAWPIGELLRGRTPLTGFRLGDPFKAGRVEVKDLRLKASGDQTWTFGTVVLEGLDLARFDADIPPGPFQAAAIGARLLKALSLRRLEERDVIYTAPFSANTVGFVQITGENYDRGKLGGFALAHLEATAKTAAEPSFALGEIKAVGIDMNQILTATSQPSWRPGMPVGRLNVEHVKATGFGGELFTRYGISLGSIGIDTTHESGDVSRTVTKVEGFVMVPPSRGVEGLQMRIVMAAMGLKELKLALECGGKEDRPKGEVAIERCALTGDDLGELNLTGRLVNADAIFWRAVDSGNAAALYGTRTALGEAKFVFADKGLLERSMKAMAAMSGQTPAATRANMALEIKRYQPPNVLITEDMTKLLETVARFVEKGGTLTLDARPDPPFGLDKVRYLQQPGPDLVSLLGLSASVAP